MKTSFTIIIVCAILLFAFAIRVHGLAIESLWYDEGLSIHFANLEPHRLINEIFSKETNPPLYYILLRYWIRLFGDSEFSARLLSVIFGVLTVLLIYHVGRLLFDKKTGIISAVLVSVSGFYLYFSQEVRMYSLLPFLALASMYFFLKLLDSKRAAHAAGYAVSTFLLLYTNYSGVFIIVVQNIYFLTSFLASKKYSRQDFLKWLFIQMFLIILYIPGIAVMIKMVYFEGLSGAASGNPALVARPPFSVIMIFRFLTKACGTSFISYLFILLSVYALVAGRRDRFKIEPLKGGGVYLSLLWLLCPLAITLILPKSGIVISEAKYFSANAIALYLLAARGLAMIRPKYIMALVLAIIFALSLENASQIYSKVNKEPWRRAVKYIDENARAGDLLILNPPYYVNTVFDYYNRRDDLIVKQFPPSGAGTTYVNERTIKELMPIVGNRERVWFVQAHIHDPLDLIVSTLRKSYDITDEKNYYMVSYYRPADHYVAIKIYLFEKKR